MNESKTEAVWAKTPVSNLVRYVPSGKYFARVRVGGKLIRKSLKTHVLSVAQMRLNDMTKEHRRNLDGETRVTTGKMSFGDALEIYKQRLDANATIKEGAKIYRRKCIKALVSNWPTLVKTPVGRISKDACLSWAATFAEKYSPSVYNNTVDTLRQIIAVAVKQGARYGNPAAEITKRKILPKKLTLPSPEQFDDFIKKAEAAGGWCSRACADLIRFLAYGGFRKTEAANITWGDCDFDKGQINVRITKNGEARFVPMIPEMRQMLERVRAARVNEAASERVMGVQECQKAIDNAAKKIGMARITHHDLRHLFATRCIESGVDIPTVSRWLGHRDGGALAMKVYGHLRDQHSTAMAQKVSFSNVGTEDGVDGTEIKHIKSTHETQKSEFPKRDNADAL